MIDFARLQPGTVLYHVKEDNQFFSRDKIIMTDADGIDWYRYDRPLFTFDITEYMHTGTVIKIIQGTVSNPDDYETEYHLEQAGTGSIEYWEERDGFFEDCYLTLEAAQQRINELREERKYD
jgi:hypothetical protein